MGAQGWNSSQGAPAPEQGPLAPAAAGKQRKIPHGASHWEGVSSSSGQAGQGQSPASPHGQGQGYVCSGGALSPGHPQGWTQPPLCSPSSLACAGAGALSPSHGV